MKQNNVKGVLIRSDSTGTIQRVKDTRAGPGQEVARKIKKIMSKIEGEVYIEWVKGHSGDRGNQIADKVAGEARSRSQKKTTISNLMTMISKRVIRDNYPEVPSKYYLFDYTTLKRSNLDEERRSMASTISRLRGNCAIMGTFL